MQRMGLMQRCWSERIAQKYHLQLPPDLRAWVDDDVWKRSGGAEFRWPQSPKQLLDPDPGVIWAGFMLPDTLPLVGNRYGDWLCLRIAPDGSVSEVIYWCHGGGDWIPYGRTLAEAIVYDAAFRLLYPQRAAGAEENTDDTHHALDWAHGWIGAAAEQLSVLWEKNQGPINRGDLLSALLASGVAEVPARRDQILYHLESKLKVKSDPQLAQEIGAVWEPDFVSWLFDTALIPELRKEDLSRRFRVPVAELVVQDWDAAEQEALKVAQLRQDLGWALDIAGWAAERRGDYRTAVQRYLKALPASLFSDESIKFRTHWFSEGFGKFSAARLFALKEHLPAEVSSDPYLNIFWLNDPESLRARVRDYWIREARQALADHRYLEAYRAFYNAGWDLGLQYLKSYVEIFDGLVAAADAAQSPALASLARLHQRFLSA